jgi:hypothetical protein
MRKGRCRVMDDVKNMIDGAIKAHEERLHKKGRKVFRPPTLEEVKEYIRQNPELSNVNAYDFWKGYNDSDPPWIDTQGKPVRNWKLKLRTRSNCQIQPINRCRRCGKSGSYAGEDDTGQRYYLCDEHQPKKKPMGMPEELTKDALKTMPDKKGVNELRNEQTRKLIERKKNDY